MRFLGERQSLAGDFLHSVRLDDFILHIEGDFISREGGNGHRTTRESLQHEKRVASQKIVYNIVNMSTDRLQPTSLHFSRFRTSSFIS